MMMLHCGEFCVLVQHRNLDLLFGQLFDEGNGRCKPSFGLLGGLSLIADQLAGCIQSEE